jgi:pimeloyl-ACP methyl ester carboxylesterase
MVAELHSLLNSGHIPGPYVLVGHSLAGLNIHLYASTYPQEVVGLVFVDAIHPELDARIEKLLSPTQVQERRADLELNDEGIRFNDILTSEGQVRAAGPVPDVPVTVIRHGLPFEASADWPSEAVEQLWAELQTDLSTLTAHGKVVVALNSHHRIQETEPEVVSAAIQEVVNTTQK